MELWLLEGIYHYEDTVFMGVFIGVYTSETRAESAAMRRAKKYDIYLIDKIFVNCDYEDRILVRKG